MQSIRISAAALACIVVLAFQAPTVSARDKCDAVGDRCVARCAAPRDACDKEHEVGALSRTDKARFEKLARACQDEYQACVGACVHTTAVCNE
jgi:hypothetical protein